MNTVAVIYSRKLRDVILEGIYVLYFTEIFYYNTNYTNTAYYKNLLK
jgi:hypothetical protein